MGLRWRLILASLVFLISLVYALPSVPVIGPALEGVLPSSRISLGLDLKGGIHLTLGVDVAKAVSNSLAIAGQDLRRMAQDEKIVVLRPRVLNGTALEFLLPRADNEAKLREILARHFPQLTVGQPQVGEGGQLRYVARFTPAEVKRIEELSLDQALRTIRNRIDQFGVAEPDIRKQAGNRIQVQLPGISDPRRAVQIIGQTAHLEFHLVREDVDPNKAVLPAPVSVLEERSVGPSLGQEAIDSGVRAAVVGAAAVVVFIGFYYGLSGLIANLMLCFTMLIVMAGMGAFGATLTLPGIAGIVLTIGMAVDANVLIYERIREELRLGLTPLASVRAGFDRAMVSITDANLTSIIVTVILYQFGTGPIRGFAVTLGLGIVASMFTAIFVSRAIFEEWARHCGPKGLSI